MHNEKDIRWKQRFQNFQSAFKLLESAIAIKKPTEIERAGLIQFFEITFELSWKLLKDYLEEEGFTVKTPRQIIKQAFQAEFISDGDVWLSALNDRSLTVHTYDENTAIKVEMSIRTKYFPVVSSLYNFFLELEN